MLGGYIGQFLPLAGGKLNGAVSLGGNTLNMNTGGGSGGGNIHMDGGAIFVAGGEFSMNDGSGSGGDFFNADGAYINAVGGLSLTGAGASITLAGGMLSLNGGGGSGGGSVLMDGGKLTNATLVNSKRFSGGTAGPMTASVGTGPGTGGSLTATGNDVTGIINVTSGTSPLLSGILGTITFNNAYENPPCVICGAASYPPASVYAVQSSITTTQFVLKINGILAAGTNYTIFYHVFE